MKCDIKKWFGSVPHDKLKEALSRRFEKYGVRLLALVPHDDGNGVNDGDY